MDPAVATSPILPGEDLPRRTDPASPRRKNWLLLSSFLLVTISLWGWFLARAASTYQLEIPYASAVEQSTKLFYWHEGSDQAIGTELITVSSHGKPTPVRFPLGREKIARLQFDTSYRGQEVTVGSPVLKCLADNYFSFDIPYQTLPLASYVPLNGIQSVENQGTGLRIIPANKVDLPICAIHLDQPLTLGFSAGAFARTFSIVAVGWVLLVLAVYRWADPLRRWRARLTTSVFSAGAQLLAWRPLGSVAISKSENAVFWIICVVSATVQVNAVLHGGSKGQDYPTLYRLSEVIATHPGEPWRFGPQDPPVFVLTNALLIWLADNEHGQVVCGLFNMLVNVGALWIFYRLARHFIENAVARVALLVLVAFLPVRLIQTVVLAGDALTLWPFFTLAWVMVRMTAAETSPARRRVLAFCGGLLVAWGVLTKYTFMSALVALAILIVQLARRRRVSWLEAGLLLILASLTPLGVIITQQRLHPDFTKAMDLGTAKEATMSYRDVLGLHGKDLHIFRAPPYDEPLEVERRVSNGQPYDPGPPYELLMEHRHSFLALNHLAIFTDPLNIFQYDPTDAYFGQRSPRNQRWMVWAVRSAVPITLACVVCMVFLGGAVILGGLVRPANTRPDLEAVFLLAFGWFSNIVVFLPFIAPAYIGGFWTPRLTLPALLIFLLFTFYVLDRLLTGRVRTGAFWLILIYVGVQSVLQVSFLWPWGKIYP